MYVGVCGFIGGTRYGNVHQLNLYHIPRIMDGKSPAQDDVTVLIVLTYVQQYLISTEPCAELLLCIFGE